MAKYFYNKYTYDMFWNTSPNSPNAYSDTKSNVLRSSSSTFNTIISGNLLQEDIGKVINVIGTMYLAEGKSPNSMAGVGHYFESDAEYQVTFTTGLKVGDRVYVKVFAKSARRATVKSINGNDIELTVDTKYDLKTGYTIYQHIVKSDFIEVVSAEDGTYPDNGFSGGFWYEKVALDESIILTSPNGGETVNEGFSITWTLSAAGLKTKIELSTDNGNTWKTLLTTNAGVTSYSYDFANELESSICKIRVTPTDGNNTGTSDVSDGVFTIAHNQAPTVPTNLAPANGQIIDRTEIQRLNWKHNDNDAQSKFDLQWSSDGGQTWTTVTKISTNQYSDFAANTFPVGTITWRVRTYDQEGLASPYSNQVTFTAAAPSNAPTITSAAEWNVSRPTIQWSSVGQVKYQVQILDSINAVVWDSGQITSSNKAVTVGADLVNGSTYTVKVRIADSGGIWSSYAVQSISISFTPPEIPLVTATIDTARASITLEIVNPEGLTIVTHNDIFRDGERIATGIIGGFTDYTVESEKEYSYRVRAVGENGTYSDSEVTVASVVVKHTQLALTTNYNKWIELKWNPEKSDNRQHNSVSNYFAGRKFAVTDFSENENNNIPNSFAIRDKAELDKLIEIYDAKETVLYRDRRGKRLFGTLNNLSIADESPRTWWTVSFTVNQVDFNEVI